MTGLETKCMCVICIKDEVKLVSVLTLKLLLKLRRVRREVHTLDHDMEDTGNSITRRRNLKDQSQIRVLLKAASNILTSVEFFLNHDRLMNQLIFQIFTSLKRFIFCPYLLWNMK